MDSRLQDLADETIRYAIDSGAQYCDARAELQERKSALIENGEIEHVRTNKDEGIGIRLVKEGVWSFCSITNPKSIEQIKEIVNDALRNSSLFTKYFELVVYHGFTTDLIILDVSEIILSHSNPIFINSSSSGFFKTG